MVLIDMNPKTILLLNFLIVTIDRIISAFKQKERKGDIIYSWTSLFLILSYILCVSLALFEFFVWKKTFNMPVTITGSLLILGGIILRKVSIRTLGDNWSLHIKQIPSQQLITTGPYKWLRHPYYTAVILELSGTSLYFNSFLSLGYVFVIHLSLLLVRISFEEKILLVKFQNRYERYRQETGMFLPKWY